MMGPPPLLYLRIPCGRGRRAVGLWLPLVLLWLVVAVCLLALLPALLVVAALLACSRRGRAWLRFLWALLRLLPTTSGLRVELQANGYPFAFGLR